VIRGEVTYEWDVFGTVHLLRQARLGVHKPLLDPRR
jgi:hypothetical protein